MHPPLMPFNQPPGTLFLCYVAARLTRLRFSVQDIIRNSKIIFKPKPEGGRIPTLPVAALHRACERVGRFADRPNRVAFTSNIGFRLTASTSPIDGLNLSG